MEREMDMQQKYQHLEKRSNFNFLIPKTKTLEEKQLVS